MKKTLKLEILEKLATLVTAALGFVAALAWNEAVKKLFEIAFGKQSNLLAMIIYAIIVTIIVVFLTVYIGRAVNKLKKDLGLEEGKE